MRAHAAGRAAHLARAQDLRDREEDRGEQFLDGLATANALYIQISSLDMGSTSAEFRVAGAQHGIDVLSPPIASLASKKM